MGNLRGGHRLRRALGARTHASPSRVRQIWQASAPVWDGQILICHLLATLFLLALQRLGIPHMRWHDLRHFYASVCASEGIDIHDVSVWFGHANVSITQSTYVHLFKRSAL